MQVALIGNGYWGSILQKHIPNYFDLKYIADSKFDMDKIWYDKEIKAVIIATPIEAHYNIIMSALLYGKHIFTEKPVTPRTTDAKQILIYANQKKLKIGVDYTWTFSKGIQKLVELSSLIGPIEFIEMYIEHLGRFMNFDVYWLLASHYLSVLNMFQELKEFSFKFFDVMSYKNKCTTGSILCLSNTFNARITVSLNYPGKNMKIIVYGKKGTIEFHPYQKPTIKLIYYNKDYKKLGKDLIQKKIEVNFDENNNLNYAMKYFQRLLNGKINSNMETAIEITKILENRNQFYMGK